VQSNIAIKTLLLSAILISLAACSDSGTIENPFEQNNGNENSNGNGTTTVTTQTDGSTTNAGETQETGNSTAGGVIALNSNVPQFNTSACDTLPVSDAIQSNAVSAPTAITTGQVVKGRIDPDSATNTEHFWSVDLLPGFYHVVLESSRVDDAWSNLGIVLTDLRGFESADDVQILRGNEIDYRSRYHAFIEVEQARTMVLRAAPNHRAEDYLFAIFENGSAVPSPFFSNCPSISTLSLGTTESLTLPESNSIADDRWYQVELNAIDHVLQSSAARTDGRNSNIQYRFRTLDQFGQSSRIMQTGRVNEIGVTATGSGPINRTEPGNVWIRLVNDHQEITLEFTLNSGS